MNQIPANQVKQALLSGMLAASPDEPFQISRSELEALTQRFYAYQIPIDDTARNRACMFTMGRNHAISSQRGLRAYANRHDSVVQKLGEAVEQAQAGKDRMREFLGVVLATPNLNERHIRMVWHRCFELANADEIQRLFPNTTKDQRDQWKRRGMLAIQKLCPPGLWEYMQFRGTDQGYRRVG
jgi:hypothetical protein